MQIAFSLISEVVSLKLCSQIISLVGFLGHFVAIFFL